MPKEEPKRQEVMRRWSEGIREALPTAVQTSGIDGVTLQKSDHEAVFLAGVLASLFVNGDPVAEDSFAAEVLRRFKTGLARPKLWQRTVDADEIVSECCRQYAEAIEHGRETGAVHNYAASSAAERMLALLSIFVDRRFEKVNLLSAKAALSTYKRRRDGRLGSQAILVKLNKLARALGPPSTFGVETIQDAKKKERQKDA